MKCDIVIPDFNEATLTKNCLESIAAHSDTPYRVILIDNASAGETKKLLEDFVSSNKNFILTRNKTNVGWVKAVNQGIKMSMSPYVCIMNNDTIVRTSGWLAKLIEVAESSDDIGLVNPRFDVKNDIGEEDPCVEIDFCRGYCALIKRTVIEKIGALDEAYGLGYYDDDDFSVRAIRAGFRCVRANNVVIEHLKDSTFSTVFNDETRRELHEKNKWLFYSKWGKRLKIVFIVTKASDGESLKRVLLHLVRRQHIVYLWNAAEPVRVKHINVRERSLPCIFRSAIFALVLYFNTMKKDAKRYDLVFIDDPGIAARLSRKGSVVFCVNADNDADNISQIVDRAANC